MSRSWRILLLSNSLRLDIHLSVQVRAATQVLIRSSVAQTLPQIISSADIRAYPLMMRGIDEHQTNVIIESNVIKVFMFDILSV